MDKPELIKELENFKTRLTEDVHTAYSQRGPAYGRERFNSWRRSFTKFLDIHLPAETTVLNKKLTHYVFSVKRGETPAQKFWREDGDNMHSYIDSLILDIKNNEHETHEPEVSPNTTHTPQENHMKNKVFIVHGHDGEAKERTARFIEKLGFEAIILHEQPSRGMTIIEKIEKYSNEVNFAIVLYTPDDLGNEQNKATNGELNPRARQNVIFEHGFLIGKLGRNNVTPLVDGNIELPSDISGIVYISDEDWKLDIAKEMKEAGYEIDFNLLF